MDWDAAYLDGTYRRWDLEAPSGEIVATLAAAGLPERGLAVDLGCGAGTEAIFLAETGLQAIGVDLSEEALRLARRRAAARGVKVTWELGNVIALPFGDRTVGFANDRGCLQHLAAPDRRLAADEVARVMLPGGTFLLRACRECADGSVQPVTPEEIDRLFPSPRWDRGYVLPLDVGSERMWLTLLRRRSVRW
jgi:ubiquinone/menaquinone biosynthesis C-methylase UbiE